MKKFPAATDEYPGKCHPTFIRNLPKKFFEWHVTAAVSQHAVCQYLRQQTQTLLPDPDQDVVRTSKIPTILLQVRVDAPAATRSA